MGDGINTNPNRSIGPNSPSPKDNDSKKSACESVTARTSRIPGTRSFWKSNTQSAMNKAHYDRPKSGQTPLQPDSNFTKKALISVAGESKLKENQSNDSDRLLSEILDELPKDITGTIQYFEKQAQSEPEGNPLSNMLQATPAKPSQRKVALEKIISSFLKVEKNESTYEKGTKIYKVLQKHKDCVVNEKADQKLNSNLDFQLVKQFSDKYLDLHREFHSCQA